MKKLVVLGNFDGVHLGHQKLINSAIEFAKDNNYECIIYTFSTLANNKKYIMTKDEKIETLKSFDISKVYVDDFYSVKNYNASEFINEILKNKLNAEVVFCGYNYTFACNKSANIDILKNIIKTVVIDEFKYKGETVSSSAIRKYIEQANIKKANELLNKNFIISGLVIHGKELGRKIGYPTANIKPNALKIMPKNGVYGVKIRIENDENTYMGIMNIGTNPTVSDKQEVIIETHILDFNKDIYGKNLKIYVYENIRFEKKFDNIDMLINQIKIDIEKWKEIYAKY